MTSQSGQINAVDIVQAAKMMPAEAHNHVPRVSVVICTHNRADYLVGAVESVFNQDIDPALFEVIIVDNNTVPDLQTKAVAERFASHNLVYVLEPALGLSYARNSGVRHARAEYIAFLDDDAQADSNWLRTAMDIIERCRPAVFGGMALPLYSAVPKPEWFEDRFIVEGYWGKTERALVVNEYVYGMNMFWRRDTLDALGGFDPAYGMAGKKIAYAEETILQIRLRACLPAEMVYYHPALTVHHVVRAEKMQWSWIVRQRFARGRYSFRARYERKGRKPRSIGTRALIVAKSAARMIVMSAQMSGLIVIGTWRRSRKRYPHARTYIYERGIRPLRGMGALYEKVRLMMMDKPSRNRVASVVRSSNATSAK